MKIDSGFMGSMDLDEMRRLAQRAEEVGYDALLVGETTSDPFIPLTIAAEHTTRIQLATAVAVAFARTPMTTAYSAHDLQRLSRGRFTLGLGSQVQPHVERRFSMPWSKPAPRMREFVLALRAIWRSWDEEGPLDFRGDFYSHTLMTPFWAPPPSPYGAPEVFLAALGPRMTEVAAEVADGVLIHDFSTERYVREVSMPAIHRGLDRSGRARADFEVAVPMFLVTGATEEAMADAAVAARKQIAFYASTRAFRSVLELHGWGELQTDLHALAKQGRWEEMADLVEDEVLDAFGIVAEPDRIAARLADRYGDIVDRCNFVAPDLDPAVLAGIVEDLRRADGTGAGVGP